MEMSDDLERFDEGLGGVERIVSRGKNRVDGALIHSRVGTVG